MTKIIKNKNFSQYGNVLRDTAIQAGKKIMEIRDAGLSVSIKDDRSPVTIADQEAEKIILNDLNTLAPDIPIIAEESVSAGIIPEIQDKFWLVDPLDGTRDFIAGGSDFTVNIALIENKEPTFGIVYAPVNGHLYMTTDHDETTLYHIENLTSIVHEEIINVRQAPKDGTIALASRFHTDEKTNQFIEAYNVKEIKTVGSSLKFCLVAKGEADFYPRFTSIMEWDTAAGHAILIAAGGSFTTPEGKAFFYQKPNFRNAPFIARGKL